jgi:hypothetical protein
MIAIGNDELEAAPQLGKTIKCPICGNRHKVEYAEEILADGTKRPSKLLAFYRCGGNSYLAGIDGKEY